MLELRRKIGEEGRDAEKEKREYERKLERERREAEREAEMERRILKDRKCVRKRE